MVTAKTYSNTLDMGTRANRASLTVSSASFVADLDISGSCLSDFPTLKRAGTRFEARIASNENCMINVRLR